MKTLAIILALLATLPANSQKDGDDIVIGKYRKLYSAVTNEDRTLLVWLPRSYNESTLSYPVVYLLYGQNTSAYFMPAITACDMLASSGKVPEMIVVGVASAERYRDYSSVTDGYIENTVRFFREELFPFINSNYRTQDYRIVIGPQAGAVFSFYTLLQHPDLFHAYIIENPFVWQNRETLFSMAEKKLTDKWQLNRFLYIREEKDNQQQHVKTAVDFSERMVAKAPPGFRFSFSLEEPSGYFVPPVPAKEGLQLLFRSFVIPDSIKVLTLDDIKSFYQNSSRNFGISFNIPEHVLTMKSDELMAAGRYSDQAGLLEYMLSIYPRSLNALLRMGDLKRTLGDYGAAIQYYDEFLKIMPVDAIGIRNRRDNLAKYINESLVCQLEKEIFSIGIEKAVRNFKRVKASKENKLTYEENDLNTLGYTLLNRQMYSESIKVFKLALEIYSGSANLYDSLGEAYMRSGAVKDAILNYEKSLQLNPGNENAKRMLENLKIK